jgi:hypothetical protein
MLLRLTRHSACRSCCCYWCCESSLPVRQIVINKIEGESISVLLPCHCLIRVQTDCVAWDSACALAGLQVHDNDQLPTLRVAKHGTVLPFNVLFCIVRWQCSRAEACGPGKSCSGSRCRLAPLVGTRRWPDKHKTSLLFAVIKNVLALKPVLFMQETVPTLPAAAASHRQHCSMICWSTPARLLVLPHLRNVLDIGLLFAQAHSVQHCELMVI